MPIENSVPISPLRQSLACVGDPSGSFNAEWQKRAEEELNETPENLKQEVFALRQMVQSKLYNMQWGEGQRKIWISCRWYKSECSQRRCLSTTLSEGKEVRQQEGFLHGKKQIYNDENVLILCFLNFDNSKKFRNSILGKHTSGGSFYIYWSVHQEVCLDNFNSRLIKKNPTNNFVVVQS